MATYFLFGKYSAEAFKDMGPGRTEKTRKLIQKFGGEIKSIYALFGDKDLVIIATLPGTEQALKFSIALAKSTGIAFTTSEAVDVEVFDKLVSDV